MTLWNIRPQRLVALCGLWASVHAFAASTPCPDAIDMNALQLQGQWMVQVTGQPRMWLLQLEPHPEHTGSLRGQLQTGSQRHAVVADLDDGEFTLEETHDGQHIAATWLGRVQAGSCGQTLRGERLADPASPAAFVMRRNGPAR